MARNTGNILKLLRKYMGSKQYVSEKINAYIIPSGDAHQVYIYYIVFKLILIIILL